MQNRYTAQTLTFLLHLSNIHAKKITLSNCPQMILCTIFLQGKRFIEIFWMRGAVWIFCASSIRYQPGTNSATEIENLQGTSMFLSPVTVNPPFPFFLFLFWEIYPSNSSRNSWVPLGQGTIVHVFYFSSKESIKGSSKWLHRNTNSVT